MTPNLRIISDLRTAEIRRRAQMLYQRARTLRDLGLPIRDDDDTLRLKAWFTAAEQVLRSVA